MERSSHAPWQTNWPISTIGSLFLAAATGMVIWTYLEAEVLTPPQRYYWNEYLNTELFQGSMGDYSILEVLDRRGNHRIAVDTDVVIAQGMGVSSFLSFCRPKHAGSGAADLEMKIIDYGSMQMHQVLSQWIYEGRSVTERSWPAWVAGLTVFVLCIVLSARHSKRQRTLQDGQRLRGPQVVTVSEFNHWSRGDGIGFLTTHGNEILRIPGSLESSHIMIMGDSGSGKSILQRQVLLQIAERNETAIVYDPALEYTPQFYQPDRGDLILNPLDARCPYWSPSDELVHEAEALTHRPFLSVDFPSGRAAAEKPKTASRPIGPRQR